MEFTMGQGVIFCDQRKGVYSLDVLNCFRQIHMAETLRLRSGIPVWVPLPSENSLSSLHGYILVSADKVNLHCGADNHLSWRIEDKIIGSSPIYSSDYTRSSIFKLIAPKRLGAIIKKHPELLWENSIYAANI